MSANLNIVELPPRDLADIPRGLRALADGIERGDYGDAHNLAWAVDCGSGGLKVGLLGASPCPGAEGHLLFSLAAREMEISAMGGR